MTQHLHRFLVEGNMSLSCGLTLSSRMQNLHLYHVLFQTAEQGQAPTTWVGSSKLVFQAQPDNAYATRLALAMALQ
jgi:hypothetical protein